MRLKTYAIPTISKILVGTRQFVDPKPAPKRYVDTTLLVSEFIRWPLDSERASQALAREFCQGFLHLNGYFSLILGFQA